MIGWHPPERDVSAAKFLEPLTPLSQQLSMSTAVHKLFEMIDGTPYGQVNEDAVILIRPQGGGIAFRRLQAPDKAGAVVGQSVDLVQARDESSHDGIVKRRIDSPDVDLCNVWMG